MKRDETNKHQDGYAKFIEDFESINPYQLDHLCDLFYRSLSDIQNNINGSAMSIRKEDLREMFIRSMHLANLEIAHEKLEQSKLLYENLINNCSYKNKILL